MKILPTIVGALLAASFATTVQVAPSKGATTMLTQGDPLQSRHQE